MKKTIGSLILVLLLVLTMGVSALADYSEGTLYYTVEDDSVTITGYFGKEAEVTIPAMIAGYPVNTIGAGAFMDNSSVKVVNLPDTIMTVEEGAFAAGITVNYNSNLTPSTESGATGETTGETAGEVTPAVTESPDTTTTPTPAPAATDTASTNQLTVGADMVTVEEGDTAGAVLNTPIEDTIAAQTSDPAAESPDTEESAEAVPTAELADPTAGPGQSGGSTVWLWCLLGVALLAAAAVPVLRRQRKS